MFHRIASLGKNLRVGLMDAYGDGTVWASIEDGEGRGTQICIDGREGSPTRHRLFEMARHPRKQGAVLIDLGAPEEGVIVPLLSRWLDSDEPRKLGLREEGKEIIQGTLSRLGEPAGCRGDTLLEVLLPRSLTPSSRQVIEDRLTEALAADQLGRVTGGGYGGGITDFFVAVTDVTAGLAVIRRVLREYQSAADAIIKQYEPVQMYRLDPV